MLRVSQEPAVYSFPAHILGSKPLHRHHFGATFVSRNHRPWYVRLVLLLGGDLSAIVGLWPMLTVSPMLLRSRSLRRYYVSINYAFVYTCWVGDILKTSCRLRVWFVQDLKVPWQVSCHDVYRTANLFKKHVWRDDDGSDACIYIHTISRWLYSKLANSKNIF